MSSLSSYEGGSQIISSCSRDRAQGRSDVTPWFAVVSKFLVLRSIGYFLVRRLMAGGDVLQYGQVLLTSGRPVLCLSVYDRSFRLRSMACIDGQVLCPHLLLHFCCEFCDGDYGSSKESCQYPDLLHRHTAYLPVGSHRPVSCR